MNTETNTNRNVEERPKQKRGFACMPEERVRELAILGGKAAAQSGVAHKWTREEARVAGKKGGLATQRNRDALKVASPLFAPENETP